MHHLDSSSTVYFRPSPKHPCTSRICYECHSGVFSAPISGMHVPIQILAFPAPGSTPGWSRLLFRLLSSLSESLPFCEEELRSSSHQAPVFLCAHPRLVEGFCFLPDMAAMATLAKPLAGAAVPVASGGALPGRAQAGKSQLRVLSKRGQGRLRAVENVESSRGVKFVVRASESEGLGSAADAGGNSVVLEVMSLPEEPETEGIGNAAAAKSSSTRKPSPLQRGGSLSGEGKEGKAPAASTLGKVSPLSTLGTFDDPRWKNGTWDISMFTQDGKTNWDAVIDAEVVRRKLLEANPVSSNNDEPVVFDTSIVPWWAWVKRFHLPEAELLNGRAAMIGYASGWLVDAATGVGLVDQQNSFLGKLLLFISVVGVLAIRKNSDVDTIRNLAEESTYYDKQWQATWKDAKDPEKPEGL